MKLVLLQHNNPFTTNSAYSTRIRALVEGLSKLDVNITIFITGGYNTKEEWTSYGRFGRIGDITYEYLLPIKNFSKIQRITNKYLFGTIYLFLIGLKLNKRLRGTSEAVIWPSDELAHLKAAIDVKEHNKYYLFFEMVEFPDIHRFRKENFLNGKVSEKRLIFFEKTFLPKIDGIAFITKTLQYSFNSKVSPGTDILHLPMVVDLNRFDEKCKRLPNRQLQMPYIAYVGSMSNMKDGIDILIESFSRISPVFPQLKLYLFGYWHYDSSEHLRMIKDYNLENSVLYVGGISSEEIPFVLKNATLLVLPRPDSHQSRGGFPTKLGEYLATGNPVCATKVGELPDYLVNGESVFFAEPGSVDSFTEVLLTALNDSSGAKRVGINGRKVAEKFFNSDIQVNNLFNFLINKTK